MWQLPHRELSHHDQTFEYRAGITSNVDEVSRDRADTVLPDFEEGAEWVCSNASNIKAACAWQDSSSLHQI